jgi:hypothetical protein
MTADEAKDEALRLLDEDRWAYSVWDARVRRFLRKLCIAYLLLSLVGMFTIAKTWPHRLCISVASSLVLFTYVCSLRHKSKTPSR